MRDARDGGSSSVNVACEVLWATPSLKSRWDGTRPAGPKAGIPPSPSPRSCIWERKSGSSWGGKDTEQYQSRAYAGRSPYLPLHSAYLRPAAPKPHITTPTSVRSATGTASRRLAHLLLIFFLGLWVRTSDSKSPSGSFTATLRRPSMPNLALGPKVLVHHNRH